MTKEEKREKVQRLSVAQKKIKEMLEREPIVTDLHPGNNVAQNWPFIIAAYSGLEQTIKLLIADEQSYTIKELLDTRSQSKTEKNKSKGGVFPYRTHDLAGLFCHLDKSKTDIVREYYGQFQSLHSYIKIDKLDDFLNEISREDGRGYERWRYTLIEDEVQMPRNSPEALVAIWEVCTDIAIASVYENQRVRMLEKRLTQSLFGLLQKWENEVSINQQDAGLPFQDLRREAREQVFKGRHPLNVYAEILWHFNKHRSHGLANVSDQLSEVFSKWAANLIEIRNGSGMTSLRWFVERAQGRTTGNQSIRWNSETRRFEDIP